MQTQIRDQCFRALVSTHPAVDHFDHMRMPQVVRARRRTGTGHHERADSGQKFMEPKVWGALALSVAVVVGEERYPVRVKVVDRGAIVATILVQVRRHEHRPVLVPLGLTDQHPTTCEIDIIAVHLLCLARAQTKAVNHPEHHRNDQLSLATIRREFDRVGGIKKCT